MQLLGAKVAYDFRSADVRAGGQGAPLAADLSPALLRGARRQRRHGGAQSRRRRQRHLVGRRGHVVAFDTGPANAPINDFIKAQRPRRNGPRRRARARPARSTKRGSRKLLQHPYLSAPYPKSLDRFDFTAAMAEGLDAEDGAATLTAFTAGAVGKALDLLPQRPKKLVVCGGGRHNPTIMAMLASRAGVEVVPAEAVGWRGDAIEAECFAFLAVRVLRGLPISFPTTTGVPHPMHGGRVAG